MEREEWADLIVVLLCLALIGFFGTGILFGWWT